MTSITGTYEHTMDAKGRLFVPAKLREDLGSVCYLTLGVDNCLAIHPQESWDRFAEKAAALPMGQSKHLRAFFANAMRVEPDSQGRIVIPQFLRQYAGLVKEVIIIGANTRAEIWDAGRWQQAQEAMTENLTALMESLEV